jgi:lipopolysaccharide transport system ATP-binding protein
MVEPAVVAEGVSKCFRLYKDRASSLKALVTRGRSRYEDFWALRDVSLTVPHGSAYGLVGHNGSGKSTMLRLMARIHRPTEGCITTHGRISALLDLGAGFHPELSGRENVYMNGAILGLSKAQIDGVFDEIVEFSGLHNFIDSPVKIYSSGMYVRLGFAVAVHVDPEILIIDEVISVGDMEFQQRCLEHIYELRRRDVTVLVVSHSIQLIQTMCDRAAWLDHGHLMAEGTALDVTRRYVDHVNAEGVVDPAAGDHRGSGEIRVTGVEFLDPAGQPNAVVSTGESLTVRVHYHAREAVQDPVFGLALHSESGLQLAGPSTRVGGHVTGMVDGDGYIDYRIDRLAVTPGTVVLTVGVFDRHELHQFDYLDFSFELHVQPGKLPVPSGLIDLGGTWIGPVAATRANEGAR